MRLVYTTRIVLPILERTNYIIQNMINNIGVICINSQNIRKVHPWKEDRARKYLLILVWQQENNIPVTLVSQCSAADPEIL